MRGQIEHTHRQVPRNRVGKFAFGKLLRPRTGLLLTAYYQSGSQQRSTGEPGAPETPAGQLECMITSDSDACCEWKLQENLVICLPNNETAYVSFGNELLHAIDELIASNGDLFACRRLLFVVIPG